MRALETPELAENKIKNKSLNLCMSGLKSVDSLQPLIKLKNLDIDENALTALLTALRPLANTREYYLLKLLI